ncbi:MAG: hypothetical protein JXN64_00915 [Spirochaetes bacterium]|nr:hypothetical protein [Spirochaetota bacterium]
MKEKSKIGKKKKPADKSNKKSLIKQLTTLLKDVDEDGISFLIRQAQVFIYNKKVDEHNAVIQKGVKITVKKPPFSDKVSMEIKEADDGSSFIFVINSARKFFTLQEMRIIVNMCNIATEERDASRRLFTWFKNNRGDVLNDIGIESSMDPSLATIYNYVSKRYKLKNSK